MTRDHMRDLCSRLSCCVRTGVWVPVCGWYPAWSLPVWRTTHHHQCLLADWHILGWALTGVKFYCIILNIIQLLLWPVEGCCKLWKIPRTLLEDSGHKHWCLMVKGWHLPGHSISDISQTFIPRISHIFLRFPHFSSHGQNSFFSNSNITIIYHIYNHVNYCPGMLNMWTQKRKY